jgi:hypothetical protein
LQTLDEKRTKFRTQIWHRFRWCRYSEPPHYLESERRRIIDGARSQSNAALVSVAAHFRIRAISSSISPMVSEQRESTALTSLPNSGSSIQVRKIERV